MQNIFLYISEVVKSIIHIVYKSFAMSMQTYGLNFYMHLILIGDK